MNRQLRWLTAWVALAIAAAGCAEGHSQIQQVEGRTSDNPGSPVGLCDDVSNATRLQERQASGGATLLHGQRGTVSGYGSVSSRLVMTVSCADLSMNVTVDWDADHSTPDTATAFFFRCGDSGAPAPPPLVFEVDLRGEADRTCSLQLDPPPAPVVANYAYYEVVWTARIVSAAG